MLPKMGIKQRNLRNDCHLAQEAHEVVLKTMYQTSYMCGAGQVNNDDGHEVSNDMEFSDIEHDEIIAENGGAVAPRFSDVTFNPDDICDIWAIDDVYFEAPAYAVYQDGQKFALLGKFEILSWLAYQVSLSPSGHRMLDEAMESGWSLAIEDLDGPDFHLDVPEKLIVLDCGGLLVSALGRCDYFRNIILVSFVRALRDVWQEKRHGGFDAAYGPEAILMLERTRAADLDVMAVLAAWEIRGEGYGGLWRHMIGSEDGDIAMRFSGYLERDPSALFNGRALAAAFTQWFRSNERVAMCEHEVLNDMDVLIEERQGMSRIFGNSRLGAIAVESLSCLPDRTAYLQGMGDEVLRDVQYAGMTSMVNQAHLMQVLHDAKAVRVQGVPFRDVSLAEKIFPNGEFTPANDAAV
jgi:hypothetical protein